MHVSCLDAFHLTQVNFDFAWRHQLGMSAPPRPCGAIEKGVNYGTGKRRKWH